MDVMFASFSDGANPRFSRLPPRPVNVYPKLNHANLCKPLEHRISRRRWLGGVAAGTTSAALGLGLARPALAEQIRKQNKQVLFIWIDGGISQFESWDPKPNTEFGGPFRSIETSVP